MNNRLVDTKQLLIQAVTDEVDKQKAKLEKDVTIFSATAGFAVGVTSGSFEMAKIAAVHTRIRLQPVVEVLDNSMDRIKERFVRRIGQ